MSSAPHPQKPLGQVLQNLDRYFSVTVAFWINLLLATFVYWELDWGTHNLYRYDPWFEEVPPEILEHLVTWIAGFFFVSFGAAVKKGKLDVLVNPKQHMNAEAYRVLADRRTTVAILVFAGLVYFAINHREVYHLVYEVADDKPVVEINNRIKRFQGDEIPWFPNLDDNYAIDVRDSFDIVRAAVNPEDAVEHFVFPKHMFLDLNAYYFRKDFKATLHSKNGDRLGEIHYDFDSKKDLDDAGCKEAGIKIPRCKSLIQAIFRQVYDPATHFPAEAQGHIEHEGQLYAFEYRESGDSKLVTLDIEDLEVKSHLLVHPEDGFEEYWGRNEEGQRKLIEEFRKELPTVSPRELERAYHALWDNKTFQDALKGTSKRREAALKFARSTLAESAEYLRNDTFLRHMRQIRDTNLKANETELNLAALAVDVLCSLIKDRGPAVRREGLTAIEDYIVAIGDSNNSIKDDIAKSLLTLLNDNTGREDTEQTMKILSRMHRSGTFVQAQLEDLVNAQRLRLKSPGIVCQMDQWMLDPSNYKWRTEPCPAHVAARRRQSRRSTG